MNKSDIEIKERCEEKHLIFCQ